jgi:Tfp pilus assembly protein PilN
MNEPKKININLYPYKAQENQGKFMDLLEKYFPFAFIGGIGAVMLNVVLLFFAMVSVMPYQALQKKWERDTPAVRKIDSLRKDNAGLSNKQKRLGELTTPGTAVSRIMADVYRALPENIWLDSVAFSDKSFVFSGNAVKWKEEEYMVSLDKFMKNLRSQEYFVSRFSTIDLKSSRKAEFTGRQIMRFEIECKKPN